MAKFDAKNPPIFFDATGRRWFFTKVITFFILINLFLVGVLISLHYNREGAFDPFKNSLQALAGTAPKTSETTLPVNPTFSLIRPGNFGTYAQIRAKLPNISYVLCECLSLQEDKLIDKSKSDYELQDSLEYLANNPLKKVVPINQYVTLTTNNLNTLNKLTELPTSRIVLDLNKNKLEINELTIKKLTELKTSIIKKNIQLDLVIGSNQTLETFNLIKSIANDIYIVPFSYINKNVLDPSYKLDNLKAFAQNKGSKTLHIIYPNLSLDGIQGTFEASKLDTISFDQGIFPYVMSDKNKIYLTNEYLYNNYELSLTKMGIANQFATYGTENLVETSPNGLAYLQTKSLTTKKELLENQFRFTDGIIREGNAGAIVEIVAKAQPAKLNIDYQTGTNYINQVKLTQLPTRSKVVTRGVTENSVALSFDDGPDPVYTPQILDILKANNVKASFFVLGTNAEKYPEIIERIAKEGHLIGNHTYSHINVNYNNSETIKKEITKTNEIIEKVSLVKPYYFRTPLDANAGPSHNADLVTLQVIKDLGMRISESDNNSEDYANVNASQLIENTTKNLKSQILLHDAGGDRTQTIIALPEIINKIKQKGIQLVTIEELDGQNKNPKIDPENYTLLNQGLPVGIFKYLRSGVVDLKINDQSISHLYSFFYWFFLFFLIVSALRILLTLIGLIFGKSKTYEREFTDYVSVLVPAYNEEQGVIKTVESLLRSTYQNQHIVVIDDGSSDNTLINLTKKYSNHPKVKILTKSNGGKASALNYGLQAVNDEYIVCVDADSIIEKNSVFKLMQHFNDPKMGAVAGNVQIGNEYFGMKANNPRLSFWENFNIWTSLQRLEYTTGQNFIKESSSTFNSIYVVPGAIGAFRKSIIDKANGYKVNTLAEDMDLTVDVLRDGWKVIYEREAFSITEAPETMHQLWKQRIRWGYGGLQVFAKNADLVFKSKNFMFAKVEFPMIILNQLSMLAGLLSNAPLIYYGVRYMLSIINPQMSFTQADFSAISGILFLYLTFIFIECMTTIFALYRDKSKGKYQLLWLLPASIFLYSYFRIYVQVIVYIKILTGKAQGWNHLQRTNKIVLLTD